MSFNKMAITCPACSQEFWRTPKQIKAVIKRSGAWSCKSCVVRARNVANAKPVGSTRVTAKGYIMEKTADGWIMQHVLVMERHLGRSIDQRVEVVHHVNEIKSENDVLNLELKSRGVHTREHHLGAKRGPDAIANIKRGAYTRLASLPDDVVRYIRQRVGAGDVQKRVAQHLNISPTKVSRLIRKETYSHVL